MTAVSVPRFVIPTVLAVFAAAGVVAVPLLAAEVHAETVLDAATVAVLPRGTTGAVGALPGAWSVGDDGQGTYDIEVTVPAGVNGLRPHLVLQGRTGAGDGPLGFGWNLTGLSAITRCPRNHAQADGFPQAVGDVLQRGPAYCLDGQLLVVVAGTDGADGAEYRTEAESFRRVVLHTSGRDAGPQGFEVFTKDGTTLRYGYTGDATVAGRRWLLAEQSDRSGNYLSWTYDRSCVECAPLPATVGYGGHRGAPGDTAHDRAVRFGWEDRPDVRAGYDDGHLNTLNRRLARIETTVGDRVARRYRLDYSDAATSRIQAIRECTDDPGGAEVCRPATTVEYSDARKAPFMDGKHAVASIALPIRFGAPRIGPAGRTVVLDVNGDGRDDLLYPVPAAKLQCGADECNGTWTWGLATATGDRDEPFHDVGGLLGTFDDTAGVRTPAACPSPDGVLDYNGDGRDDLLSTCGPSMGAVFVSTGSGFVRTATDLPGPADATAMWLADVDGDARPDVVTCAKARRDGLGVRFGRGAGRGFGPERTVPNIGQSDPAPDMWNGDPCGQVTFLDTDGDGALNLMKQTWKKVGTVQGGAPKWRETWNALTVGPGQAVWTETGLVFEGTHATVGSGDDDWWKPYPEAYASYHQLRVLDVNGDGLDDVLAFHNDAVVLQFNTGHGFTAAQPLPAVPRANTVISAYAFRRAQVVDVDRDGRDDLLIPVGAAAAKKQRWVLYRAQGAATLAPELLDELPQTRWGIPVRADVDGDGSPDLIVAADEAGLTDEFGNPMTRMTVRSGDSARADRMTAVGDGLGRRTEFFSNGERRVYEREDSCRQDEGSCLNRMGPLVAEVTELATTGRGVTEVRRHTYRYGNARRGWYGRGDLGMGEREEHHYDSEGAEIGDAVARHFDNVTFHDAEPGSSMRRWYPFAGLDRDRRDTSPVVSHGLDTPADMRRVTLARNTWKVQVSAAGRPFSVQAEATGTTGMYADGGAGQIHLGSTVSRSTVDDAGDPTSTYTEESNGSRQLVQHRTVQTAYDLGNAARGRWLLTLPTTVTTSDFYRGVGSRRVDTTTYDDRGVTASTTRNTDSRAETLTTRIGYDGFGNATSTETGAPGLAADQVRRTATRYDARGLLAVAAVNAEGHRGTVRGDPVTGRPLVTVDPNGRIRRYAYDGFDRVTTVTGPTGTARTGYLQLNAAERMLTTVRTDGGPTTYTKIDALGRTTVTGVPRLGGGVLETRTRYDDADRVVETSQPLAPTAAPGPPASFTTYDGLGRVSTTGHYREARAVTTTMRYGMPDEAPKESVWQDDGLSVGAVSTAATDDAGHTSYEITDYAGQVVVRVDPNGAVTRFGYGPFGELTKVVGPGGDTTTFAANRAGRTLRVDSPDAGTQAFSYTPFGDPETATDAAGALTTYRRDRLGRTTGRTDARGTATWTYDGPAPYAVGKLAATATADGQRTSYEYDSVQDGPAAIVHVIAGTTYRTGYLYNAYGQVSHVEYPPGGGRTFGVDNSYDDDGNLETVRDSATRTALWAFGGSRDGVRISTEQLGNGSTVTRGYEDDTGLPTELRVESAAGRLQDLTYGYDQLGNLAAVTDAVATERSRTFTYDAVNRPTAAGGESFGYAPSGRIVTQKGIGAYSYERPHAVASAGANTYTYDARGNQVRRQGPDVAGGRQSIEYTPANLPSRITTGSAVVDYAYDADENRVLRRTAGSVTAYATGYERRDLASGKVEHRYDVTAGGRRIAQVIRLDGAADRIVYEHADPMGSPVDAGDVRGGSEYRQDFSTFGALAEQAGADQAGDHGFTGRRQEADLGLVDLGGRFYDPRLGRFISADPVLGRLAAGTTAQASTAERVRLSARPGRAPALGAGDLLDPYAYAGNNPLAWSDPSGGTPVPRTGWWGPPLGVSDLTGAAESAPSRAPGAVAGMLDQIHGFGVGFVQGLLPAGPATGELLELALSKSAPSREFEFGRGAGALTAGVVQLALVPPAGAGAVALAATGLGAPAAVAVGAAGTYLGVNGGFSVAQGAGLMGSSMLANGLGGGFDALAESMQQHALDLRGQLPEIFGGRVRAMMLLGLASARDDAGFGPPTSRSSSPYSLGPGVTFGSLGDFAGPMSLYQSVPGDWGGGFSGGGFGGPSVCPSCSLGLGSATFSPLRTSSKGLGPAY